MRHFGPEDQRLWKDVTEELMSDEEDSLNEPGVWVARPPRFRAQRLTQLCYHLDANTPTPIPRPPKPVSSLPG